MNVPRVSSKPTQTFREVIREFDRRIKNLERTAARLRKAKAKLVEGQK